MDSIFVKVPVTERLPEKDGPIACVTEEGKLFITEYVRGISIGHTVKYWLQEIQLPSAEEIKKARDAYSYSYLDPFRWGWKYGVKHILSILKGSININK